MSIPTDFDNRRLYAVLYNLYGMCAYCVLFSYFGYISLYFYCI